MRPHRRALKALSGGGVPELPVANLLFGSEADVGLTLVGSEVTLWADVSPNGNDGAPSGAGTRPEEVTDGTLGTSVFFDAAAGDNMDNAGASDPSNNFTISYVLNYLGGAGAKMFLFMSGGAGGATILGYDTAAAGGAGAYYVNDGTTTQYYAPALATGAQVLTYVVTGADIALYVNRTLAGTITMGSSKVIDGNICVGSPFSTSFTPDINLRARYFHTVAKDAAGRTELWDYIKARHPGAPV